MTDRVLVTGGTGTLGRVLCPQLAAAGYDVVVLSRSAAPPGADVERRVADLADPDDARLRHALRDVDTVVHLASDPRRPTKVDVAGTDRLMSAAAACAVGHVVLLSIVGCDANPYPYYRAKATAESIVLGGGAPAAVLRATQFHEFVPLVARLLLHRPLAVVPRGLRAQLVDLRDVAERLVEIVGARPHGRVADLAGPEVIALKDALVRWARATGRPVPPVLQLPPVGRVLRAFAEGSNLPSPGADIGRRTFDAWLAEQHA